MSEERIKLLEQQIVVFRQDLKKITDSVNEALLLFMTNQKAVFTAFDIRLLDLEEAANVRFEEQATIATTAGETVPGGTSETPKPESPDGDC